MAKICENAETHLDYSINIDHVSKTIEGAIATNVVETAHLLDAKLIVAATMSGKTAKVISNLRPQCCTLAACTTESVARGLMLNWGVYPVITKPYCSTDEIVNDGKSKALEFTDLKENDIILITGGFPNNTKLKSTNFMKIEKM